MKINVNEIKVGMLIEYKNDLWEVTKTQHVKPGKGGAFNQVEMKSINNGTKINERFRSSETVEKATVEEFEFTYIYKDTDLERLKKLSKSKGYELLTTEKDYFRIKKSSRKNINFLKVDLLIDQEKKFFKYLNERL